MELLVVPSDKRTGLHMHHYRLTQNDFPTLKIPCATFASLPTVPATLITLLLQPFCLFQNVTCGNHTASQTAFSLRNVHLRFTHVFSWLDSSFLFIDK